jgi:hypothetical protein
MPSISGSVGSGALNRPSDVLTVQKLLNRKNSKLGGLKPLVEDGISGPNTINAIKAFQANVVKLGSPDGRVDTNGQTIVYLNQANYDDTPTPAPPANNPVPPSVPAPSEDGEMRYPDRTVTIPGVEYSDDLETSKRIVSTFAKSVIRMALNNAGIGKAVITSTLRLPEKQAQLMYDNAKANLTKQYELYKWGGDQVLHVFRDNHARTSRDECIALMAEKIRSLMKQNVIVSRHVSTPSVYATRNIIDIGVNSSRAVNPNFFDIEKMTEAFTELQGDGYIAHLVDETKKSNSCWHLEIVPNCKTLPAGFE